jgi:hypothetical protein
VNTLALPACGANPQRLPRLLAVMFGAALNLALAHPARRASWPPPTLSILLITPSSISTTTLRAWQRAERVAPQRQVSTSIQQGPGRLEVRKDWRSARRVGRRRRLSYLEALDTMAAASANRQVSAGRQPRKKA